MQMICQSASGVEVGSDWMSWWMSWRKRSAQASMSGEQSALGSRAGQDLHDTLLVAQQNLIEEMHDMRAGIAGRT